MTKRRTELDAELARRILSRLDRVDPNTRFDVKPMGGGVSSTVLLCENGRWRHVLKQPLGKFRVRDEWIVGTERTKVEYEIAKFIERHMGQDEIVPVIEYDEPNEVLVMEAAGASWTSWKERMLQGEVRLDLGKAAATMLARFHSLVRHLDEDEFRNDKLFDQQRLDPYLRTAAGRAPEVASKLERLVDEFPQRDDLVHGDFSPKNLLTNGFNLRAIDHEVATRGDAAFDLGFLINHLLLKSVHLPKHMEELHETAWATFDTYMDRSPVVDDTFEARFSRFLAALHLARAIGKSKAEYLTDDDKEVVTAASKSALNDDVDDLAGVIRRVRDAHMDLRATTA